MSRVETGGLLVAPILHDFIEKEALPDTGVESAASWGGFAGLTRDLAPANKRLLARRDELQAEIDAGHRQYHGKKAADSACLGFLRDIGYLPPEAVDFQSRPRTSTRRSRPSPARSLWCRSPMRGRRLTLCLSQMTRSHAQHARGNVREGR